MISDDQLCEYITQNPGKKFSALRVVSRFVNDEGYRTLDKTLQRLRRSGRVHYKAGGWYPGKGYTV
jgi:hypothetical protein